MANDRRVKGCPGKQCERSIKKYRYKATDMYCTICGNELVFVCADCFKKLDDSAEEHRFCAVCEAKRKDKKDKRRERAKKAGTAALSILSTVGLGAGAAFKLKK